MELHSKDRFKKIPIMDIAISKVQRIEYKGLSNEQNEMLYRLSRMVLIKAQRENDSNEAAFTIDLDDLDGEIGEVNGTEHYAAEKLRVECCADLKRGVSSTKDYYNAALDFLTHCSEVGLYYQ